MIQRIISGILGAALFLAIINYGGLPFTLAIGLLTVLGILEYGELIKKQNLRSQTQVQLFSSLSVLALIYVITNKYGLDSLESLRIGEQTLALMLIISFILIFCGELFRGDPEQGLINGAANLFGTVYIGFMFAYILLLRFIPGNNGLVYVLFTVLVTWANDSAAFFIGINFGKHKLSPKISPKKSIEGSIGGLGGGLLGAAVLSWYFQKPIGLMLVLGCIVVVAGQFGDLVESVIKRNAGVKDSGNFLPGHGGVLDRFDSLLLSAPVVYYIVTYFGAYYL
ncbi:MAG: phosphatidate cytidylyltransferase [Firmicutes bacterium]|nr:phosphatidate cytidylyltransferase [Bacillota bacterium]